MPIVEQLYVFDPEQLIEGIATAVLQNCRLVDSPDSVRRARAARPETPAEPAPQPEPAPCLPPRPQLAERITFLADKLPLALLSAVRVDGRAPTRTEARRFLGMDLRHLYFEFEMAAEDLHQQRVRSGKVRCDKCGPRLGRQARA